MWSSVWILSDIYSTWILPLLWVVLLIFSILFFPNGFHVLCSLICWLNESKLWPVSLSFVDCPYFPVFCLSDLLSALFNLHHIICLRLTWTTTLVDGVYSFIHWCNAIILLPLFFHFFKMHAFQMWRWNTKGDHHYWHFVMPSCPQWKLRDLDLTKRCPTIACMQLLWRTVWIWHTTGSLKTGNHLDLDLFIYLHS